MQELWFEVQPSQVDLLPIQDETIQRPHTLPVKLPRADEYKIRACGGAGRFKTRSWTPRASSPMAPPGYAAESRDSTIYALRYLARFCCTLIPTFGTFGGGRHGRSSTWLMRLMAGRSSSLVGEKYSRQISMAMTMTMTKLLIIQPSVSSPSFSSLCDHASRYISLSRQLMVYDPTLRCRLFDREWFVLDHAKL